ncbi:MAG: hypothetical protein WC489_02095 [Patescibacteria group bacterium]
MERFNPAMVQIEVTTRGRGRLYQVLSFPDGTKKEGPVCMTTCDEGEDLLHDLSRRVNPVFTGTQLGWYSFINGLLGSRGQSMDFPE